QSGIQKRKKARTYPRLSCKIEYLLASNPCDRSIASEFFTGDYSASSGATRRRSATLWILHSARPESTSVRLLLDMELRWRIERDYQATVAVSIM
ncbi:hypothetical protein, partial [Bradyrhizobium yuanmingense]|uniref:hypothetical protein n=1 Tax=Bradyrhizobium yuanmingense TaxID=108015 RepID=UPI001CD243FE